MRLQFLPAVLLFPSLSLAQTQTPVDIPAEPHHRLILENSQVRVFAVSLAPHQQSYVRHQHNFLVVTLAASDIVMWNEGQSSIQHFPFSEGDVHFFYAGPARGLRNDTNNEYRNVTVEFLDPKVTTYGYQYNEGKWNYGSSSLPLPVDPHGRFGNVLPLGAATVKDVQLLPGDKLTLSDKSTLVIPVTDSELSDAAGAVFRWGKGEAVWVMRTSSKDVASPANSGKQPARLALVEFK